MYRGEDMFNGKRFRRKSQWAQTVFAPLPGALCDLLLQPL